MAMAKKEFAILHSARPYCNFAPHTEESGAILLLSELHHFSAECRAKWQ
jgi:hypothetical protein